VDPVPDPLLLIKSGSNRNQTRDLWVSIDQRRGQPSRFTDEK
jgi:hypothetical protein